LNLAFAATIREYERRRTGEPGTLGGVVKQAVHEGARDGAESAAPIVPDIARIGKQTIEV
jgi:hypothetical protein